MLAFSDIDVLKSDFSCGSFSETYTGIQISAYARINGVEHSGLMFPLNNELFSELVFVFENGRCIARIDRKGFHSGLGFFLSSGEGLISPNEVRSSSFNLLPYCSIVPGAKLFCGSKCLGKNLGLAVTRNLRRVRQLPNNTVPEGRSVTDRW